MPDSPVNTDKHNHRQISTSAPSGNQSLSMHADVPVWYDCCSCEAEPYWLELAEEPVSNQPDCQVAAKESSP